MSVSRVIRERRTIHKFKAKSVSRELVMELLNDAVWAPNHRLTEPWRFIYVNGDGKKKLDQQVLAKTKGETND